MLGVEGLGFRVSEASHSKRNPHQVPYWDTIRNYRLSSR